ncbi:hypothetical protein [Pseudoalteromonas sp. MMG012]|uniref:hypothetical protein n=1 Tax=Pseudoalteromonas sp. MMG012 TaxID=2822686 RepID=UPI001B3A1AB3|nr:hypothetical protein [Pseudoalteromonas sp. MMG012]MBQ4852836.1 hypothetical protein [Pseudoalteromonas sp. MMG012]
MRLLIFLLALSSVFFVSNIYAVEYIDSDYAPAQPESAEKHYCMNNGSFVGNIDAGGCQALGKDEKRGQDGWYGWTAFDKGHGKTSWKALCDCGYDNQTISYVTYHYHFSEEATTGNYECPTDSSPNHHIGPVFKPNDENDKATWCLPSVPNRCPTPKDSDPYVFGTGNGKTEHCFDNEDGTQCKIETGDDGGYYVPTKYGSAEPSMCARPPNKEVDKTTPPPDKGQPNQTDGGETQDQLSASNKINKNLDALNKNQIDASNSNDSRLDRLAEESQIGNEVLAEIRFNTSLTQSQLNQTNTLLQSAVDKLGGGNGNGNGNGDGNGDGDGDGEEEPPFNFDAGRKNDEGLNAIFTTQQLQDVTDEVEDKKQELKDYLDEIKAESSSLFEISPSLSATYEERTVEIKGVNVDMGLSRLSDFFRIISAAVLLLSSLTALYILLGP